MLLRRDWPSILFPNGPSCNPSQEQFPWREMLLRRDWPSILFPNGPSCNPSQEQFPWREMLLRRDWPSILFPNGPSCNPCQPKMVSPVLHVFTGGSDSSWLSHLCFSCRSESSNI